jgi:hypothetical protein
MMLSGCLPVVVDSFLLNHKRAELTNTPDKGRASGGVVLFWYTIAEYLLERDAGEIETKGNLAY